MFIEPFLVPDSVVRVLRTSTHVIPQYAYNTVLLSHFTDKPVEVQEQCGSAEGAGLEMLPSGSRAPLVGCRLISKAFPFPFTKFRENGNHL